MKIFREKILNPIEEATGISETYQRIIRLKQDEVAEKVSKSRAAITNSLDDF